MKNSTSYPAFVKSETLTEGEMDVIIDITAYKLLNRNIGGFIFDLPDSFEELPENLKKLYWIAFRLDATVKHIPNLLDDSYLLSFLIWPDMTYKTETVILDESGFNTMQLEYYLMNQTEEWDSDSPIITPREKAEFIWP